MTDKGKTSSGHKTRRIVYYGGRVQGVGFRYTACRVAERFHVTGTVRNLPDGQVEVIAEGDEKEVDAFLKALQREMKQYIGNIRGHEGFPTGEFADFRVAY